MATETVTPSGPPVRDAESEIAALVAGGGTLLVQACAVVPGLLPCLLLILPLLLPLVALGAAAALLLIPPYFLWRLVTRRS